MREEQNSKLRNIIERKFKTTYIGAIYAIEKAFGIVWDKELDSYVKKEGTIDDETLDLFADIRDEILDIGNAQCRNLKSELAEYFEIQPRIYRTNFRIAIEEKP